VNEDILSKFGMQIVFDLLKYETSPNPKPEIDFQRCGRHLGKSIWRHNSVAYTVHGPIQMKFGSRCRITCRWRWKIKVKIGNRIPIWCRAVCFQKPEVVISAVDWDAVYRRHLVCRQISAVLSDWRHQIRNRY